MKKLLLAMLLLLPGVAAADGCLSGSFYDPENSGWGINVDVLEDQTVVFVYKDDGDWLVLQGNSPNFGAYQKWADGVTEVGTGDFVFLDNDTVFVSWDLVLDINLISFARPIPWCLHTGCEYDGELVRLTQPVPCD